jgi:hypothetical protein
VPYFRKKNSNSVKLEINSKHLIETSDLADEFSKRFNQYTSILPITVAARSKT